jgi:hypothetical protein
MREFEILEYRIRCEGQGSGVKISSLFYLVPFSIVLLLGLISYVSAAWFGLDSCPSHWGVATGYADACRFQAPEDGISTRLEILTWTSAKGSTFRLAIYDDEDGHPKNRLWEGTDVHYQGGVWCGEDVTTIHLSQDAFYWFAFKTSAPEEMCYVSSGPSGSHEWKINQAYSDTFPHPWGGYTGYNSNRYTIRMHYVSPKGTKGIIQIDPGIIEGGFVR